MIRNRTRCITLAHRRGWMWSFVCWLAFGLAQADTFRWQDPTGKVFYGDEPPDNALSVEPVDTHECHDDACREEQRRRFEDLQETNRALDEWLERRAREQAASESSRHHDTRTSYIPSYPALPTTLILAPDAHSLCDRGFDCLRTYRPRSGIHRSGSDRQHRGTAHRAPNQRSYRFPHAR